MVRLRSLIPELEADVRTEIAVWEPDLPSREDLHGFLEGLDNISSFYGVKGNQLQETLGVALTVEVCLLLQHLLDLSEVEDISVIGEGHLSPRKVS